MKKGILALLLLVIFLSSVTIVLASPITLSVGETKTVRVDGRNYEIKFKEISDEKRPKVRLDVGGESKIVKRGEIEKIRGIYILVINVSRTGENQGTVKFEVMENVGNIVEVGDSKEVESEEKDFEVHLKSISSEDNPRAMIKLGDESEIFKEGEIKELEDAVIGVKTISRTGENEGFVIFELVRIITLELELDDKEEVEIADEIYEIELREIDEDGKVVIEVDDERVEFLQGQSVVFDEMELLVKTVFPTSDDEGFVEVELSNAEANIASLLEDIASSEVTIVDEVVEEEPEEVEEEEEETEEEVVEETEEPVEEVPEIPITGQAATPPEARPQGIGTVWVIVIIVLVIIIAGLVLYRYRRKISRRMRGLR
jgi:hypothetical protein